jgi:transposase
MRKPIKLRTLTTEEVTAIKRLASSRKEPIRLVQRARVIAFMVEDPGLHATDAGFKAGFKSSAMGPGWVRRFNEKGLPGLKDRPRPRPKSVRKPKLRSALIAMATQKPRSLGYRYSLWTLKRLQQAFEERHGARLSLSTIWGWLAEDGLDLKQQWIWLHTAEKLDPN